MRERALVLGGGGSTGNAWSIGVIAGLFDAGLDVTVADVTVGTSAGATAAAQLAGAAPADLFAAALEPVPPRQGAPVGGGQAGGGADGRPGRVIDHLERSRRLIAASVDAVDRRRRVGVDALDREAASDGSWQARQRATVASRLPDQRWPRRALLVTAVDAETGEPVVFDRHSGVDLVDAVAASCSSSLPFRIGDRRYVDGAYRRNENADLAAGHGRVLVLSPLGGRSLTPPAWGLGLGTQVDELRAQDSRVEVIVPDPGAEELFGAQAMDPTLRPVAARSGYELGAFLIDRLTDFWR
ncbi:patatin-like phospholipase family protein [Oerskovia turbata]